jgi:hypothetical protein
VAGFTLSGLSKYFETVGRERPLAAANSSIVLTLLSVIGLSNVFQKGTAHACAFLICKNKSFAQPYKSGPGAFPSDCYRSHIAIGGG